MTASPAPRDAEPSQILYWCQDTAAVAFETGIQRVVRRLAAALPRHGAEVVPVGWNARHRRVETLAARDGEGRRLLDAVARPGAVLFVPEIALSLASSGLDPLQLGRAYGLRTVGFVHDLVPMKLAADYEPAAVAVYRRYYRQFASADLALAATRHVADDLARHLRGEGLPVPPVAVEALPAEFPGQPRWRHPPAPPGPGEPLRLLAVGTWEPRKNLRRMLRGVGLLLARGVPVSLVLVGRRGGFPDHDREVLDLAAALPGVVVRGDLPDAELAALYRDAHASLYPSLEEGFGMPVFESLWFGRPCLCHHASAMAEAAPGGGTLLLDMADEEAIADALLHLARGEGAFERLAAEAVARPLRDWDSYAAAVLPLLLSAGAAPAG